MVAMRGLRERPQSSGRPSSGSNFAGSANVTRRKAIGEGGFCLPLVGGRPCADHGRYRTKSESIGQIVYRHSPMRRRTILLANNVASHTDNGMIPKEDCPTIGQAHEPAT